MLLALVASLAPPVPCASCAVLQNERGHSCCVPPQTTLSADCCSRAGAVIAENAFMTIAKVPAAGALGAEPLLSKTGDAPAIASRCGASGRSQPQIVLRT